MTGYGQASEETPGVRVTVAVRSVNNRYLDIRLRLPSDLMSRESEIRRRVHAKVRRGRVELSLGVERIDGSESGLSLNRPLIEAVVAAASELRDEFDVEGSLDVRNVLSLPGVLQSPSGERALDDRERETVNAALDTALEALTLERGREGESLRLDLLERVGRMRASMATIRELAAEMPRLAKERFLERLEPLTRGIEVDPTRLAQEVAIQADRCDITEEIVRLDGHLERLHALLSEPDGEPLGKRLDFLVQEIHRETNTIGSKSAALELSRVVLDLKAETEKVREQIQNFE